MILTCLLFIVITYLLFNNITCILLIAITFLLHLLNKHVIINIICCIKYSTAYRNKLIVVHFDDVPDEDHLPLLLQHLSIA